MSRRSFVALWEGVEEKEREEVWGVEDEETDVQERKDGDD